MQLISFICYSPMHGSMSSPWIARSVCMHVAVPCVKSISFASFIHSFDLVGWLVGWFVRSCVDCLLQDNKGTYRGISSVTVACREGPSRKKVPACYCFCRRQAREERGNENNRIVLITYGVITTSEISFHFF